MIEARDGHFYIVWSFARHFCGFRLIPDQLLMYSLAIGVVLNGVFTKCIVQMICRALQH